MNRGVGGAVSGDPYHRPTIAAAHGHLRRPSRAAHFSYSEILNRLRAEIAAPPQLRYIRPQTLRRSLWREFWCDRSWVPAKILLLLLLVLLASLI